jgi:DNA-3-methyladenine glycosylase II
VRTSPGTRVRRSVREAIVPVSPPYRLDLTAVALRRLSTNVVDVFEGGAYRRLLGEPGAPVLLRVEQVAPDALAVTVDGPGAEAYDPAALVRRTLGTDVDLSAFYAGAATVPWLEKIARAARGVKPPRYPSLWETVCNAVVYQQVSIHAAGAILRRVIERYSIEVNAGGARLFAFPPPRTLLDADPNGLRAAGLSVNKVVALKAAAAALADGTLDEGALERMTTPELLAGLVAHKGIGPWTAAVVALRGFGRLDVFPMKDSGVAAALRTLSGDPATQPEPIVTALAPQQGMLYYHLLLGRLHATGEVALSGM